MNTVELRDKDFCQGCKKRKLHIYQETDYNADGTRKRCDFAQCEHLSVCIRLLFSCIKITKKEVHTYEHCRA